MAEDLDFAPAFMLGTQTACNSGSRESNAFSQPSRVPTHGTHTHKEELRPDLQYTADFESTVVHGILRNDCKSAQYLMLEETVVCVPDFPIIR